MNPKDLMLYIHTPFCIKKCDYCDFLSAAADKETMEDYVLALCREIDTAKEFSKDYVISSIFFGGGTPSILLEEQIDKIMNKIYTVFSIKSDCEISLECNPGTVTQKKLKTYKRNGINRLSIGLQSAEDKELRLLGRIHTYQDFLDSFSDARTAGFDNINVDLMSALPGQSLDSYIQTINKVVQLKPEHISAYSLILEEGTKFYDRYKEGSFEHYLIPEEETDRAMYHQTKILLQSYGYRRYEISNYAKHGFECNHNLGYWRRKEYLGIGLGASSYVGNKRMKGLEDLKEYLKLMGQDGIQLQSNRTCETMYSQVEELTKKEEMEEFMFLGLRVVEGISKNKFYENFKISIQDVYGNVIKSLVDKELITETKNHISLTEEGLDISNQVFCEFLL